MIELHTHLIGHGGITPWLGHHTQDLPVSSAIVMSRFCGHDKKKEKKGFKLLNYVSYIMELYTFIAPSITIVLTKKVIYNMYMQLQFRKTLALRHTFCVLQFYTQNLNFLMMIVTPRTISVSFGYRLP